MKFLNIFKQNDEREIAERLRAATKVTLDEPSRETMRGFLLEYARMHPVRAGVTHQNSAGNQFFVFLATHIRPMPVIAAMLIVVVSGSTVAASEMALPGDLLYPLKVHVTEEVRATLTTSAKARADWAVERAERRLEEAATLALAGDLNEETRAEIESNLDLHVRVAEEDSKELRSTSGSEDTKEIEKSIRAIRFARENILGTPRVAIAVARVAKAEAPQDSTTMSVMSIEATSTESLHVQEQDQTDDSEAVVEGNRTAAKARIEATKKFLENRHSRLNKETREQVQEQLRVATDAFSSGEKDAVRGNREEASSNFDSALRTAIDIEILVADPK